MESNGEEKRSRGRDGPDQPEGRGGSGGRALPALRILLEGLQIAAAEGRGEPLEEALTRGEDHLYEGLLAVVLRALILAHAEDRGLLLAEAGRGGEAGGVLGLLRDLTRDHAALAGALARRFHAWPRLLAIFRAVHDGRRRGGRLFDPASYPFLEAVGEGGRRAPAIDDDAVRRALAALLRQGEREVRYGAMDPAQIGGIYEALLSYRVARCPRAALEGAALGAGGGARGGGGGAFNLTIAPGSARRRSSSHYTPQSLAGPLVRRALDPILVAMGPAPSSAAILSLRVCDPAMGSGALLVEACRALALEVVDAWAREGQLDAITASAGDPERLARRLVAERCLYGVDANPFAVSLAEVSLWLAVGEDDEPFTLTARGLRHGDSLVGLTRAQILAFRWAPHGKPEVDVDAMDASMREAATIRRKILDLSAWPDRRAAQRERDRLAARADALLDRARLLGDVILGAFFASSRDREREIERARRLRLVQAWLEREGEAPPELLSMQRELRTRIAAFHWEVELPEVFYPERAGPGAEGGMKRAELMRTGMDAVLANPPFLGGKRISTELGGDYSAWLTRLHSTGKNTDLAAHFLRRADALLGERGAIGLLATNTIAQGDTRREGLGWLVAEGLALYDARSSVPWPGDAGVAVATIHLAKGTLAPAAARSARLNGSPAASICSRLRPGPERPEPAKLRINMQRSFNGCFLRGQGFLLSPRERDELCSKDPRNAARIALLLGGKEVNQSAGAVSSSYVIRMDDLSLEEAGAFPDLLEILKQRVKPERDAIRGGGRDATHQRVNWWRFARPRQELYAALEGRSRCLVTSIVSKHLLFTFQPTDRVFSHKLCVFPADDYATFAVLQSSVHERWARLLSSTLEDRLSYSSSDCFETFPFPFPVHSHVEGDDAREALETVGERLCKERARLLVDTDLGLTETYNRLRDPGCCTARVTELRELHEEVDRAVLSAYGWSDVDPPPFAPPREAPRLPHLSKYAGNDLLFDQIVIERLYALNAKRAAEEATDAASGGGARRRLPFGALDRAAGARGRAAR